MFERILVVCTGNICRSPLAEAMLRLQLRSDGRDRIAQVRSAGTRALIDKPVDETVLFVARQQPALLPELERHKAQQINGTLLWWADLILAMEPDHIRQLTRIDPSAAPKAHLLGQSVGGRIPDPYLKHELDYRSCHGSIERAVLSWRDKIND